MSAERDSVYCKNTKDDEDDWLNIFEMSEKSRKFLKENIPDALETTDVNEVLELIDDWIMEWGFEGPDDHFTDKGHEGEEAYDDIYYLNS